jgi:ABC-type Fe2+-enterobactin transport system substrate-binding protein
MALGTPTYGSSLLSHLGIKNIYDDEGSYPTVELEDVLHRAPDLILAPNEPYPFGARHLPELEQIAPAVLVDGKDLFWWGVRTSDACIRLAQQFESL